MGRFRKFAEHWSWTAYLIVLRTQADMSRVTFRTSSSQQVRVHIEIGTGCPGKVRVEWRCNQRYWAESSPAELVVIVAILGKLNDAAGPMARVVSRQTTGRCQTWTAFLFFAGWKYFTTQKLCDKIKTGLMILSLNWICYYLCTLQLNLIISRKTAVKWL